MSLQTTRVHCTTALVVLDTVGKQAVIQFSVAVRGRNREDVTAPALQLLVTAGSWNMVENKTDS